MKKAKGFAILAAAATASALSAEYMNKINNPKSLPDGFIYTAHTGCEGTAPNSLESIKKAASLGAPAAEFDVTFRKDGTPVILHSKQAGDGCGVLLSDALKCTAESSDTLMLNLDLKAYSNLPEVVRLIKENGLQDRCYYTGVESIHTQRVKTEGGGIPYYLNAVPDRRAMLSEDGVRSLMYEAQRSGAIGLNCNFLFATQKMVDIFHENSLKVSFWTVDYTPSMKYVLALGPDNITTRRPSKLARLL